MSELEFAGEKFALAEQVAQMPMLRVAHLARQGKDANDMESLDAIYEVLRSLIADEDWRRFEAAATRTRATGDELMEVAGEAVAEITSRPTNEPSDSSDGSSTTKDSSADGSSSRVVARLEAQGRPDLALAVKQAARFNATA